MLVERSDIAAKLSKMKSIVPTKPAIECMKGVLVKDSILIAYNLETALSTPLGVEAGCDFILPIKAIEMIESLPDGLVEISTDSNNIISIKAGSISNKFQSLPPEDYPRLPDFESSQRIAIDGLQFQDAINSVLYSIPLSQTSRPILTGMLMDCDGVHLNIVGCDNRRIAWATMEYSKKFKMVMPKASIQKYLQLGFQGEVSIFFNPRSAVFVHADYTFYTRLLDGEYMDYKKYFQKREQPIIIDRKLLLDSINRAIICEDNKVPAKIILDISNGVMKVSTISSLIEYIEEINLNDKNDLNIIIAFNSRLLAECLKSYRCDNVEFILSSASSPLMVDDGRLKSLIQPVQIKVGD